MMENMEIEKLIGAEKAAVWNSLTESIDRLYDMDEIHGKGFGDWV